jgi:hypothetical protein
MEHFSTARGVDAVPLEGTITDQDPAIAAAVAAELPGVIHLLCIWHILAKNLTAHMQHCFTRKLEHPHGAGVLL